MAESIQKADWERFRALGSVPPSIREIVLRSWVRSRDSVGLEGLKRAPSVADEELRSIRSRNALVSFRHVDVDRAVAAARAERSRLVALQERTASVFTALGHPLLSPLERNRR